MLLIWQELINFGLNLSQTSISFPQNSSKNVDLITTTCNRIQPQFIFPVDPIIRDKTKTRIKWDDFSLICTSWC